MPNICWTCDHIDFPTSLKELRLDRGTLRHHILGPKKRAIPFCKRVLHKYYFFPIYHPKENSLCSFWELNEIIRMEQSRIKTLTREFHKILVNYDDTDPIPNDVIEKFQEVIPESLLKKNNIPNKDILKQESEVIE